MGTYTTVVLQKKYQSEKIIHRINNDLCLYFGAGATAFGTRLQLQEEAHYLNHDPQGLRYFPGWKRPISVKELAATSFWLRVGEFHTKLSALDNCQDARDLVAVCKWIVATKGEYINTRRSFRYDLKTVQEYVDALFIEEGYDLNAVWQQALFIRPDVLTITMGQ